MKEIIYFLLLTQFLGCGSDEGGINSLPPCDPIVLENETEFLSNQIGILTYSDTIPGSRIAYLNYFITPEKPRYLQLVPCNLPVLDFDLQIGQEIKVEYSGNVEVLPETADAFTVIIELRSINILNPIDK